MQLIRGLHNLLPEHRGCVATIGNFDGVHLGHQAVLGQLAERAVELGLPQVVIIFEPQPTEFFAPDQAPPRLTRPTVVLRPVIPQKEAGTRTEPPVSVPSPAGAMPLASATAVPLLDPPAWAAHILANGLLYVRGRDRLVCLRLIESPHALRD